MAPRAPSSYAPWKTTSSRTRTAFRLVGVQVGGVSGTYGIVIWMYHDEIHHRGRPHFHATYGDDEASIDIESLAVIAGELPPRARRLVAEWARGNQGGLRDNCERARRHEPLEPIEALR